VTDSDILTIRRLASEAIAPMRTGELGPAFIECHTYRWREHVGPGEDYDAGYRSRNQLRGWQENDQVKVVGEMLNAAERSRIDAEVEEEIAEAVQFAELSPFPDTKELFTDVFAG
jgi:TPP-dependent pyruvate/acetoin dehydrogenase alpha subunit